MPPGGADVSPLSNHGPWAWVERIVAAEGAVSWLQARDVEPP